MVLGNANLKGKICAIQAKYCLILLCALHFFVFLAVTGSVCYVYFTASKPKDEAWGLLAPGVLALFSGLGALAFLKFRKQLCIIICIAWPVLMFLLLSVMYGIWIYAFAEKGMVWYENGGYLKFDTMHIVALFMGCLLIPLSCCCCVVLACLGCFIKNDGESAQSDQQKGTGNKQKVAGLTTGGRTDCLQSRPINNEGGANQRGNQGGDQGVQNGNFNNQRTGGNAAHRGNGNMGGAKQGNGGNHGGGNEGRALHKNHSGHLWN